MSGAPPDLTNLCQNSLARIYFVCESETKREKARRTGPLITSGERQEERMKIEQDRNLIILIISFRYINDLTWTSLIFTYYFQSVGNLGGIVVRPMMIMGLIPRVDPFCVEFALRCPPKVKDMWSG